MAEEFRVADNDYVDVEEIQEILADSDFTEDIDIGDGFYEKLFYGKGVLVEYGTGFRVERDGVEEHETVLSVDPEHGNKLIVGGDWLDQRYEELLENQERGLTPWIVTHFIDYDEIREAIQLEADGTLDIDYITLARAPERGLQMHWQQGGEEDGPRSRVSPSPYVNEMEYEVYLEPVEEGLAVIPLHDDVTVTVEETYTS